MVNGFDSGDFNDDDDKENKIHMIPNQLRKKKLLLLFIVLESSCKQRQ